VIGHEASPQKVNHAKNKQDQGCHVSWNAVPCFFHPSKIHKIDKDCIPLFQGLPLQENQGYETSGSFPFSDQSDAPVFL
jgi:hypothetical protein